MKNLKLIGFILLFMFFASMISFAQDQIPTANLVGTFYEHERGTLRPAFINGVNSWLRRYRPALITQEENYVLMTARYNHDMNIELFIRDGEYEIIVTVTQDRINVRRAYGDVVHIVNGVNRALLNNLSRSR